MLDKLIEEDANNQGRSFEDRPMEEWTEEEKKLWLAVKEEEYRWLESEYGPARKQSTDIWTTNSFYGNSVVATKSIAEFVRLHRKTIGAVILLAVFGLLWLFAERYSVINAGGGKVYKVDRLTGKSWLLVGTTETPIKERSSVQPTSADTEGAAIELAKNSYGLRQLYPEFATSYSMDNDSVIRSLMEKDSQADIKGWDATEVEDRVYLVTFTYEDASKKAHHYVFEVNLPARTVRNVIMNTGLYERYKEYDIHPVFVMDKGKAIPSWFLELTDETPVKQDDTIVPGTK